jgi:hypothetical protein
MKMISIISVVDVVGALANNTLSGNIYLVDNNKTGGSTGEGTEALSTSVKENDEVVWIVQSLECEANANIEGILIDSACCEPQKKFYEGTDVSYWVGKIKKGAKQGEYPYSLQFKVGSRIEDMATSAIPMLTINQN